MYRKKATPSEIEIYRRLGKHGNIAELLEVKNGEIHLKKYHVNLYDAVIQNIVSDIKQVLQDVSNGIKHMHKCGIAHNDLSPYNIMLDDDNGKWVIIDFDSASLFGTSQHKPGLSPWCKYSPTSEPDNDLYSISKLALFLALGPSALDSFYGVVGKWCDKGEGVQMPDWYKDMIKHNHTLWTQYDWSKR